MEELKNKLDFNIKSPPPYYSENLSNSFGLNVFLKHEDYSSSLGVNSKLRKLEFFLKNKSITKNTVLISVGSLPSSQNVLTAYLGKKLGVKSKLIYGGKKTRNEKVKTGNIYLASLFDPEIIWYEGDSWENHESWLAEQVTLEKNNGNCPLVIDLSGWPSLLGYTSLGKELHYFFNKSEKQLDYIVCPFGSGTIFTGLSIANSLFKRPYKTIGVTFARNRNSAISEYHLMLNEVKSKLSKFKKDNIINKIIDGTNDLEYGDFDLDLKEKFDEYLFEERLLIDPYYNLRVINTLNYIVKSNIVLPNKNLLVLITGGGNNAINFG